VAEEGVLRVGGAAPAEEEERGGGEPWRRGREAAAGRSGEPGGEEGVRVPLCGRGQMKNGSRVFFCKDSRTIDFSLLLIEINISLGVYMENK